MFDFLKKKFSRQEEEELKAAAQLELGRARILSEQALAAKMELKKALLDAQQIIEERKVPNRGNN